MDCSANIIEPLQVSLPKMSASQRYYLKNRETIIAKNKERVLNKYHQKDTYINNKQKKDLKKQLITERDTVKKELDDLQLKIIEAKNIYNDLKNKEYELKNRIQDITYSLHRGDFIHKEIEEPVLYIHCG